MSKFMEGAIIEAKKAFDDARILKNQSIEMAMSKEQFKTVLKLMGHSDEYIENALKDFEDIKGERMKIKG